MDNKFSAKIERFEGNGSWHYVTVPTELSMSFEDMKNNFGFIAITAKVGKSNWATSLLPMGDGTHFIALPSKIRSKEKLSVGDKIEISFELRIK